MSTAWDYTSKRHVRIGATRWTVEWWTWLDGHGGALPECESHDLEYCTECHTRHFPSRGLAMAFARTRSDLRLMADTLVYREQFEEWDSVEGEWSRVGGYEPVEPPANGGRA